MKKEHFMLYTAGKCFIILQCVKLCEKRKQWSCFAGKDPSECRIPVMDSDK